MQIKEPIRAFLSQHHGKCDVRDPEFANFLLKGLENKDL